MRSRAIKLGVNIDHVATLRQARGTVYPDVVEAAGIAEAAGAHGITVHLREDRRHIQDADVYGLRKTIKTRLNLEMANAPGIVKMALDVHPDEVCLVPEKREELTTEGGLDAAGQKAELAPTVQALSEAGILVSLFIDPDLAQIDAAAELGVPYVELHTGTYCDSTGKEADDELTRLVRGAGYAHEQGIIVNAGHGLNMGNLEGIFAMPHLDTLNIGHSIVARSLFIGLDAAVKEMLEKMAGYSNAESGTANVE